MSDLEQIKTLPDMEKVRALQRIGILTNLENKDWGCLGGDRFYVFANINNVPVPMYRTSARTDGKREDRNFYPFFGVQTSHQTWLLKGGVENGSNSFYDHYQLDEASRVLTEIFDFNTDRVQLGVNEDYNSETDAPFEKMKNIDNYVPDGVEIENIETLNKLPEDRFNVDFDIVNSMPYHSNQAVSYVSEKIFKEIDSGKLK